MASEAANVRSMCGFERGAPESSTQRFPAATPHVGQGTEDNCLGVSSFFFILAECTKTPSHKRTILKTVTISRVIANTGHLRTYQELSPVAAGEDDSVLY
jgi:hypothetical protein